MNARAEWPTTLLLFLAGIGLAGVVLTQGMDRPILKRFPKPTASPVVQATETPKAVAGPPPLEIFNEKDLGRPILTPVPAATPAPTMTPAPTPVPFAVGWKVKMVAGPMAILLDEKHGDKQQTIRLNEIYDEDFNSVAEAEYEAGRAGIRVMADEKTGEIIFRNYDGREKRQRR